MTPRIDEVGVILEPHEISLVQSGYVDCKATRQSPINPETENDAPIEFSLNEVHHIGYAAIVGVAALRSSTPNMMTRILRPFETRAMREEANRLEDFYYALHNTLEVSMQQHTAIEFVN